MKMMTPIEILATLDYMTPKSVEQETFGYINVDRWRNLNYHSDKYKMTVQEQAILFTMIEDRKRRMRYIEELKGEKVNA